MKTYLLSHALALFAVVAWLVMLSRSTRGRRAPQTTMAWLLAFALAPIVALPLYLALGQRKFPRRAKTDRFEVPPVRPGNQLELLGDGEAAYATVMDLLLGAQSAVDLTMFILGNDATGRAVVDALSACAQRGVRVRVILDAVGSFWSARAARRQLEQAGARVRLFMPLRHSPVRGRTNLRSHRKILIVDRTTVLAGGMNLADEYMGPATAPRVTPRFRDVVALVQGPVVGDALELFESDWAFCGGRDQSMGLAAEQLGPGARIRPQAGSEAVQFLPIGPDMAHDTLYDLLLTVIFGARERIVIVTPYFVPDEALQHALVLAVRRGVRTEILVPAWSNHSVADLARREFLRELRAEGALVHYYEKGMVHAKAMVVDTGFAYVGSPNFDMRSLLVNYEDALCLWSPGAVAQARAFCDGLIGECAEVAPTFVARPVLERLAQLVAPEL